MNSKLLLFQVNPTAAQLWCDRGILDTALIAYPIAENGYGLFVSDLQGPGAMRRLMVTIGTLACDPALTCILWRAGGELVKDWSFRFADSFGQFEPTGDRRYLINRVPNNAFVIRCRLLVYHRVRQGIRLAKQSNLVALGYLGTGGKAG